MEAESRNTKSSFVNIGERLKKAREAKSLTFERIQKETHVHSSVLSALEDGTFYSSSTATYAKSFLKKYAAYLGLDAEALGREYAQLCPARETAVKKPDIDTMDAIRSDIVSKVIYFISAAIILIAVIFFLSFIWKKIASVFSGSKTVKAASVARSRRAVSPVISSTKKKEFPKISIPKNVPLSLVIKVKEPVLVQLKRDGVILFERVLPKGTIESFSANNKFEIFIRKAEAIELTLNGQFLGTPGKGVIKELEITRKGIKIE
ncbi:MAG: DUF4115 domain-containing protein [Candidatus Omnitrophica bacterium]|nr:DUF4115 domain-containing protein [Candidatus Omnitrophota bacterium]